MTPCLQETTALTEVALMTNRLPRTQEPTLQRETGTPILSHPARGALQAEAAVAGSVSPPSKCFKDQLAVPPASAARLPCSAVPWRQASATCSLPKCVESLELRTPPGTPRLLFLSLQWPWPRNKRVARVEAGGRAGPCQCLLDKYGRENSGGWRGSESLGISVMPQPISDLRGN